jgi:hypothetical protein
VLGDAHFHQPLSHEAVLIAAINKPSRRNYESPVPPEFADHCDQQASVQCPQCGRPLFRVDDIWSSERRTCYCGHKCSPQEAAPSCEQIAEAMELHRRLRADKRIGCRHATVEFIPRIYSAAEVLGDIDPGPLRPTDVGSYGIIHD